MSCKPVMLNLTCSEAKALLAVVERVANVSPDYTGRGLAGIFRDAAGEKFAECLRDKLQAALK